MASIASRLALVLLAASVALAPVAARAEVEVDLALVLAVDVSRSMDPDEQQLQRRGYVEALRSPVVHDAIRKGALGRIALTYVEWSGEMSQQVVVPWAVIDAETASAFADRLAAAPIGRLSSTSISAAITFAVRLFAESGVEPLRRTIDVSGDGPNNMGRPVTEARDAAVAQGIVINGLPFMLKQPTGFGDIEHLDRYYEDCVIGGPGAFVMPIREPEQIAEATRNKLVREITEDRGAAPLVRHAQDRERANCLIGEMQRRQRWGP